MKSAHTISGSSLVSGVSSNPLGELRFGGSAFHFIPDLKEAENYEELNKIIGDAGLRVSSIRPLVKWLDLNNSELAEIISVSARTVSRWTSSSRIGVLPSKTMVKIDELVTRGKEIFGDDESLKQWLDQPNIALNSEAPMELLNKPFGIEMVEDVLESLAYGNLV